MRARVMEMGLIASVRVPSASDALYAAETILQAGISISEITMTVPGAAGVIFGLCRSSLDKVVCTVWILRGAVSMPAQAF